MFVTDTPAVVFRVDLYGSLAAVRTLGRMGVPVYTVDPDPLAIGGSSRYCAGRFTFDVLGAPPAETVDFLRDVARRVGGRPVLLHTGDLEAGFLADHQDELGDAFRFPQQPKGLVRALYAKKEMYRLCKEHGIPTAETLFPESREEVIAFLDRVTFPLMLKANDGRRLEARTGVRMVVVRDRDELLRNYDALDEPGFPNLMLQEYIPGHDDTVWMFNGYFDERSTCLFGLTGRKIRQHPVYTGMTSLGVCLPNETVARNTCALARATGYRGIIDIGHRFDRRDGQYKVLDVNPRVGMTFRLFTGDDGMDVVRALYLDLTGQRVPASRLVEGRKWMVEDKDLISCWRYRQDKKLGFAEWVRSYRGVKESAYFAPDDLGPFVRRVSERAKEGLTAVLRATPGLARRDATRPRR